MSVNNDARKKTQALGLGARPLVRVRVMGVKKFTYLLLAQ